MSVGFFGEKLPNMPLKMSAQTVCIKDSIRIHLIG